MFAAFQRFLRKFLFAALQRGLRRLLLAALADPNKKKPEYLEFWVGGERHRRPIRGTVGLRIAVGGSSEELIGDGQAVSERDFWEAWDAWNPHKVTYEDGTPFNPAKGT